MRCCLGVGIREHLLGFGFGKTGIRGGGDHSVTAELVILGVFGYGFRAVRLSFPQSATEMTKLSVCFGRLLYVVLVFGQGKRKEQETGE